MLKYIMLLTKAHTNTTIKKLNFTRNLSFSLLLKYPPANPAIEYDSADNPRNDPPIMSSSIPATNPVTVPNICPSFTAMNAIIIMTISGVIWYFDMDISHISWSCMKIKRTRMTMYFMYDTIKQLSGLWSFLFIVKLFQVLSFLIWKIFQHENLFQYCKIYRRGYQ